MAILDCMAPRYKGPEVIADVRREYLLHTNIEQQKEWMHPMDELPPRLG